VSGSLEERRFGSNKMGFSVPHSYNPPVKSKLPLEFGRTDNGNGILWPIVITVRSKKLGIICQFLNIFLYVNKKYPSL